MGIYDDNSMAFAGMAFVLGILTLLVVLISQGLKTWQKIYLICALAS